MKLKKMHFLDILLNAIKNKSVRVYAYCVLDETGYILMSAKTEQIMSEIMDRVREDFAVCYNKRFPGSSAAFEYEFQWLELCKSEQLIQACIELHLLPVRHGYAKQEQDYWWSSLKEYMLKYRSGIIYPEILLKRLDLNARGAVRKMKTLHRKEDIRECQNSFHIIQTFQKEKVTRKIKNLKRCINVEKKGN